MHYVGIVKQSDEWSWSDGEEITNINEIPFSNLPTKAKVAFGEVFNRFTVLSEDASGIARTIVCQTPASGKSRVRNGSK